jgi:hypothetical protein
VKNNVPKIIKALKQWAMPFQYILQQTPKTEKAIGMTSQLC